MRKVDTTKGSDPNDQQPFTAPTLLFLQQAYQEAIDALAQVSCDKTKVNILFGCVHSSTNDISAGALYYNGEIYLTDAVSLGAGVVIANLSTTSGGNITLEGGATYSDILNIRKAVWAIGTTGTGTLSGSSASDYLNMPTRSWRSVGASGEPAFANSWASNGGQPVRFKIDASRFVCMTGVAIGGATGSAAFTLPSAYRPSHGLGFTCMAGGTLAFGVIFIGTDGVCNLQYTGTSGTIGLDLGSVRFPLD